MNVNSPLDLWNVFVWVVKITKDSTISFEGGKSIEQENGVRGEQEMGE